VTFATRSRLTGPSVFSLISSIFWRVVVLVAATIGCQATLTKVLFHPAILFVGQFKFWRVSDLYKYPSLSGDRVYHIRIPRLETRPERR